jgi:glyoxylase-like metal-dependent hydrolase (beta-lactamase superfamily II)
LSKLRVAERWFEVTRIGDGITVLREPHLHPLWQSNIWHVRGRDHDLLVDAGMGIGDLRDALQPLIDKPLIAVATHRHADHVGSLHQFETRLAHPLDAEEIARATGFASLATADFPAGFVELMASGGTPVGEFLIDAIPYEGYDPATYAVLPTPLTRMVGEGDVVDLGDRTFEVLHLPGHTPGSIGLWEPRSGTLFGGDAIYDGPLFDFLPESDIPAYVETMRKLRPLPVTVVHGGHDPSFGRERMLQIIDDYLVTKSTDPS